MARTSRPTSCSWTRAPRRRPPWSPRAASSSRRRFPCSSGHPSRPSAAACRAPRWPPRSRTARCASDRGTPTVGGARARSRSGRARSRPKRTRSVRRRGRSARSSKVIRAPAPGFCQPLFFRLSPRVRAKPPETGTRRRREEGPLPEEPPDPIRANPPPPRERGERVRVGRRRDGRAVGPVPGPRDFRIDLATKGTAGWRTRRKRRRASRRSPRVRPDATSSRMERRRAGGVRGAAASRGGDRAEKEKGGARRLGSLRVRVRIRRTTQAGAEHPDVLLARGVTTSRRVSKKQNECVALLFE